MGSLSIGMATTVCNSSRATLSCWLIPPSSPVSLTINSRRVFATLFTTLCDTCNWSGRSVPRCASRATIIFSSPLSLAKSSTPRSVRVT